MRLGIFDDENGDAYMWGDISEEQMEQIVAIIGQPDTIGPVGDG